MEPVEDSAEVSKCSYSTCMENRRLAVKNNVEFRCKHLQTARDHILASSVKRYVMQICFTQFLY